MTDDSEQNRHDADEGEMRAPDGQSGEPHHALNTSVDALGEDAEAALRAEQDAAERIEDAEDDAADERAVEDRSRRT